MEAKARSRIRFSSGRDRRGQGGGRRANGGDGAARVLWAAPMTDPLDIARARNRAIVAEQRDVFGHDARPDKSERIGKGICHQTLLLSELPQWPSDEAIDTAVDEAKKALRQAVNDADGT